MVYIPPHKRHTSSSSSEPKPTPLPEHFSKTLTLRTNNNKNRAKPSKIVYGSKSISRFFTAGVDLNSISLEPFSCEFIERRVGEKPLVISGDYEPGLEEKDWTAVIVDRLLPDVIAVGESVRTELTEAVDDGGGEEIKLLFVARVGRLFFHKGSTSIDSIKKAASIDTDARSINKSFYTNLPNAYMKGLEDSIYDPMVGFEFEVEKEHFHVKVSDETRPDSTISCKCIVSKHGEELEIYKVGLNQVRHLVVDVACASKDLDLRLMLCTKRTMIVLTDFEKDALNKLIKSAVVDSDVKGCLRWPLGKETSGERFKVVGMWHMKYKSFTSPTMKLKLRYVDRFDYRTSTGEVSTEVVLKLHALTKQLRDGETEAGTLRLALQDAVKVIWEHFLMYSQASSS